MKKQGFTFVTIFAVVLLSVVTEEGAFAQGIRDAAAKGDLEAVKQAIARGEDKNAKSDKPMFTFGSSGFSKDGAMSYQQDAEWTPLIHAAFKGHQPIVQYLLDIGSNPNVVDFNGLTAFMYAISEEHTSTVAALAANQTALNFKEPTFGMTPLMWAVVRGSDATCLEILKSNPDLSIADKDGWTVLHYAARRGRTNVLKPLLEKGAPVDALDGGGKTCLMVAAENGEHEIVDLLLKAGANKMLKSKDGKTALDYAKGKLGLGGLKLDNLGKNIVRVSEGFVYQRDIELSSPFVISITSIERGIVRSEGAVPMGAESAVGMTWVFTKPALVLHNGDYIYTSLKSGASIQFTKEGAILNGFKIENPHEDGIRKVITFLSAE